MTAKGESDAARIERATADLRAVIREAHELTRDLRELVKEARPMTERLVEDALRDRLGDAVKQGLDEYAATLKDAMNAGVAKVGREFDKLAKLYLEGSGGGLPLHEMAVAARRKVGGE